MRYLIQFAIYGLGLLPPSLRGERIQAFVKVLMKPLQTKNDEFVQYVNETFYLVSFTGQVIYLEKVLNDLYDPTTGGIYIEDGSPLGLPPYLYNKVENRPLFIRNKSEGANPNQVYLRNKSEYAPTNDFIVFVPVAILTTQIETQMKGIISRYKIAGKRYEIQSY